MQVEEGSVLKKPILLYHFLCKNNEHLIYIVHPSLFIFQCQAKITYVDQRIWWKGESKKTLDGPKKSHLNVYNGQTNKNEMAEKKIPPFIICHAKQ